MISVVIPVYNDAKPVCSAVRSAFAASTSGDLDVVVVDDGSTDGTAEALAAVADPRLRVLRQENAGPSNARNHGAAHATGDWLVFLDSDDEFLPGALDVVAANLVPEVAMVRGGAEIQEQGGASRVELPECPRASSPYPRGTSLSGTFAVDRRTFHAIGGYNTSLRFSENTDLLLRVAMHARDEERNIAVIERPFVLIHRQAGRRQRYGSAPRVAAEHFLRCYPDVFRDRQLRRDYLAIIATDELRQGRRVGALAHYVRACAADPRSLRSWGRLGLPLLPAAVLARRWGVDDGS